MSRRLVRSELAAEPELVVRAVPAVGQAILRAISVFRRNFGRGWRSRRGSGRSEMALLGSVVSRRNQLRHRSSTGGDCLEAPRAPAGRDEEVVDVCYSHDRRIVGAHVADTGPLPKDPKLRHEREEVDAA